ncbi:MAG: phenylalanine--tRNA ligase subunit beta [bacterium]|nr:phenylalanine--tRNA ligase subunit beta [bacterium]
MSTDSARRFERGCDPNQLPYAADSAISLMQEWGRGEALSGKVDAYPKPIVPVNISFRPQRTSELIGVEYDNTEIQDILTRLGCEVNCISIPWEVKAPTYRPDLEREVDLIEEVVRVNGYDKIPIAETSKVVLTGQDDPAHTIRRKVEDILVGQGFFQALSLSMWNPEPRLDPPGMPEGVLLGNPVTDEMRFMQGSVLPPLFRAAAANFERGDRDLRLFETTRTFHSGKPDDPRTWERRVVAGLMTGRRRPQGWETSKESIDFFDLKSVLEILATRLSLDNYHINCYALDTSGLLAGELTIAGNKAGSFGIWPKSICASLDIEAEVAWFELDMGVMVNHQKTGFRFEPLPKFPIAWRDLAIVVDNDVSYADLAATIRESAGDLLTSLWPFDVFISDKLGSGKKSVAVRLEFLHPDRSLDTSEVEGFIQNVLSSLQHKHSAVLR